MSQVSAYIGLGSNLGDRRGFINDALKMLGQTQGIDGVRATEPTETMPLGGLKQPRYLNAAAEIKTSLSAEKLHSRLKEIEDALGRQRSEKWGSRTIDLDLLLFGSEVIKTDKLIVPHPETHLRSFVLVDLCKLNPKLTHPVLKETVEVLAGRLNGCNFLPAGAKHCAAMPAAAKQLISIAGNIGAGKTTLTKKLAEIFSCEAILERYDTNPFLPKVYAGDKALALDSQLYFLTSRVEQLSPEALDKSKRAVTDYVFQKELIYADILLSKEQRELYGKIYQRLATGITAPAILIYLADSPQECLKRIHSRNRPYEQQIQMSFLERIDAGYKKLVAEWNQSPVITLTGFNCLSEKEVERVAGEIGYYLNPIVADRTPSRAGG
ncbi:MAG: 2-amino-4-hydroxy-6-hydroxymethyldihydropteridine diphosphokinase [Sedimentisphaerales bacterium]